MNMNLEKKDMCKMSGNQKYEFTLVVSIIVAHSLHNICTIIAQYLHIFCIL